VRNLLIETKNAIKDSNHNLGQIIFIGSEESGHSCTWSEFCCLANQEYDSGYGAQQVACDLIIAFDDGQKMWRNEYDGSEGWEYSTPLKISPQKKTIKYLFVFGNKVGWESLQRLHEET